MAEIHVQARKRPHANQSWMWAWIAIGILIIAAVAYVVYKNKYNTTPNNQEIINDRNTPVPGTMIPRQFSDETFVLNAVA
jgi:hypothetical protein